MPKENIICLNGLQRYYLFTIALFTMDEVNHQLNGLNQLENICSRNLEYIEQKLFVYYLLSLAKVLLPLIMKASLPTSIWKLGELPT